MKADDVLVAALISQLGEYAQIQGVEFQAEVANGEAPVTELNRR